MAIAFMSASIGSTVGEEEKRHGFDMDAKVVPETGDLQSIVLIRQDTLKTGDSKLPVISLKDIWCQSVELFVCHVRDWIFLFTVDRRRRRAVECCVVNVEILN